MTIGKIFKTHTNIRQKMACFISTAWNVVTCIVLHETGSVSHSIGNFIYSQGRTHKMIKKIRNGYGNNNSGRVEVT